MPLSLPTSMSVSASATGGRLWTIAALLQYDAPMKRIASVIEGEGIRTVAIVGCSKNTGKTTTLNQVMGGLAGALDPIGILSIGIDGEDTDFWLGVPKPGIHVAPGTLAATTEDALKASTARFQVLQSTGVMTPLGELVLARTEAPGDLMLAGIRHKADLRLVVDGLVRQGACRVLVDGSYQRLAAADPDVSQGVILSTGAVVGDTMAEVVERTREILERLRVPETGDESARALFREAVDLGVPLIRFEDGRIMPLEGDEREDDPREVETGHGAVTAAIPGAVTDRWIVALLDRFRGPIHLLATDPTRLFASGPVLRRFAVAGGELTVIRKVRLLALTVNPTRVTGPSLPRDELLAAVASLARSTPVFMFDEVP